MKDLTLVLYTYKNKTRNYIYTKKKYSLQNLIIKSKLIVKKCGKYFTITHNKFIKKK